jgi:hypothetical protein
MPARARRRFPTAELAALDALVERKNGIPARLLRRFGE